MRAALYLRISLDKSGEELGVQRQEAECRALAEARGYEIVEVVTDNSVSATRGKRAGYERLIEAIERRTVDVVVVYRLDRLLRRLTELEALIDLSERTGVQVATVQGDLDLTTSSGRLIGRILASVAKGEMETKSERHQLANAQRAAKGLPHGSRRPYGYELDLVTIKEDEADILREMGSRILRGHGYKHVAFWLNEQGHRTTEGKLWYPITVRNMIKKKRYGGIRDYKGTEYKAIWEPIFDAKTWEALQLTLRLKVTHQPTARKYLLTGLLYCGKCGKALNGATKRDNPKRPLRRTYFCRSQSDTQRIGGCGGVCRNADALEHFVTECVLFRLDSPNLARLLTDTPRDSALLSLLDERNLQKQRIDGLVDDYATGVLTKAQLQRAKTTAESELERLDDEIATLNRERSASALIPISESIRAAWDTSQSDEWKRSILGLLIKRVLVNPGITKPYYRVGDKTYRFDPSLIEIEWLC